LKDVRRNDETILDAIGARRIPGPTPPVISVGAFTMPLMRS
jgi:hypothetical protein